MLNCIVERRWVPQAYNTCLTTNEGLSKITIILETVMSYTYVWIYSTKQRTHRWLSAMLITRSWLAEWWVKRCLSYARYFCLLEANVIIRIRPCQFCITSIQLSHTAHCFEGARLMFMNRPWAVLSLVMNIHKLFMHYVTSQHVFKCCVIMLNNRISAATITYATPSPCHTHSNGMFHQDSAMQLHKLRI